MKFENTSVYNIYNAILGARNPMNSWNRSDSIFNGFNGKIENTIIGKNDLVLAQKLIKAGSEHRKFMRQIFVSVDITAPLYWWKEFDTYKVGTVANSTSTMHKIHTSKIAIEDFETSEWEAELPPFTDELQKKFADVWGSVLSALEYLRITYNETKDKRYWKEIIRLLPSSYLQKRTVTLSYENLLSMCSKGQRRNHKLTEWSKDFIFWARTLPFSKVFIFFDDEVDVGVKK